MRLKSLTTLNTLLLIAVCLALGATLWWSERAMERPYLLMARYLGLSQQFQHQAAENIQGYLASGDALRHSQAQQALTDLQRDVIELPDGLAETLRPSLEELEAERNRYKWLFENAVHGTLEGGAISYYRLAYTNGLHGHVVTSTLPNGRTASDEYARLVQREQDTALAIRAATSGERHVVGTGTSNFGPTVELRMLNIEGGNEDRPFPVTRPLLNVPDEPLYSLSVHRLFVHGGSRYEIAVLGMPTEGEARTALEARATRLADTMVDALQTCTGQMEKKAQARPVH